MIFCIADMNSPSDILFYIIKKFLFAKLHLCFIIAYYYLTVHARARTHIHTHTHTHKIYWFFK